MSIRLESQAIIVSLQGQLAEPLDTGHDKAVIRTKDGKQESHLVRPVAQSKVASMPVGADVTFLIDELDKIVDVTMGTTESVHRSTELGQQKSPPRGIVQRKKANPDRSEQLLYDQLAV